MKKGLPPGFTLLELIVTFSILSLVVVMVLGGLRLGAASWEKGEERAERYQKRRIVLDLLSQQLKSSYPYWMKAQKAEANFTVFLGEGESIRFVSAFSLKSRRQEGLVFVIYKVQDSPSSGRTLKVFENRVFNKDFLEDTPNDDQFVTLADGLSELKFEYFDPGKEKEDAGDWYPSWDAKDKKALPAQVKVTVKWKEKKEEQESAFPLLVSLPARLTDDRNKTPLR
jgi:general secretion pathway protein J